MFRFLVRLSLVLFSSAVLLVPSSSAGRDPLRPEVALIVGGQGFFDDDMVQTYGLVPAGGVRLYLPYQPNGQFFAGVAFTTESGDPYYDRLAESEDSAHLRVTPLEAGIHVDAGLAGERREIPLSGFQIRGYFSTRI